MKRSEFKLRIYAVIGLFVFGIALFAILYPKGSHNPWSRITDLGDNEEGAVAWADTLTNSSSDYVPLEPMSAQMDAFMHRFGLRGIQIAVTRNDSLLFTKGYGWADEEKGVKMDASHVMRIASVSKLVTAVAVMKLVEQGRLSLDSRVTGPGGILNDKDILESIGDERLNTLTVDHLLQHTGGFSGRRGDPMFNIRDLVVEQKLSAPPTPREITKYVFNRKLAAEPGVRRRYSNFGYMLLSLVIEKVTGKSYWDFVNEEVLRPAGVPTFFAATNYYEQKGEKEVKYYAADDEIVEEFNGSERMVPRAYGGNDYNALLGGGGWVASAAGLSRLVSSIDLDPRVPDILTPKSIALLTETDPEDKLNIARGWAKIEKDGRWIRTGTLCSSHALIERFPDGECWIVLTNSGVWTGPKFSADLRRLVEALRARYSAQLPHRDLY